MIVEGGVIGSLICLYSSVDLDLSMTHCLSGHAVKGAQMVESGYPAKKRGQEGAEIQPATVSVWLKTIINSTRL